MSRPGLAFAPLLLLVLLLVLVLLPRELSSALGGWPAAIAARSASLARVPPARPARAAKPTGRRRDASAARPAAPHPSLNLSMRREIVSGRGSVGRSSGVFRGSRPAHSPAGNWAATSAPVTYHAHDSGIGLWGRLGDVSLYAGGFRLQLAPMQRALRDWSTRLPRLVRADAPEIGGFAGVDLAAGNGVSVGAEYRWFGDRAIGLVLHKSF